MSLAERKNQIEQFLAEGEIETSKELIESYKKEYPDDIDVVSMELSYNLLVGDTKEALHLALLGVRRFPFQGDMYYNLAYVYEITGNLSEAYINYEKAAFLYAYNSKDKLKSLNLEEKTKELLQILIDNANNFQNSEELEANKQMLNVIYNLARNSFGFTESAFRSDEQIVGKYFYASETERRFVGVFKDQLLSEDFEGNNDLLHIKGEFLEVCEGRNVRFFDENEKDDITYLIPVAASKKNTVHNFIHDKKQHMIVQYAANHFNYYQIHNGTEIISTNKSYFGNPIPLRRTEGKKRLVLSIFVDGLAQDILKDEEFKKNMPYTYEYFRKGMICDRAYNTAEWTYPSIINYVTGLDTTHHMLIHNKLDCAIPAEVPTLAEYFHKEGYYTAKIDGDWRIIPSYGHSRGYDRYVYQHQNVGFKTWEVIGDAMNHLEAFKDVNQYLWISLGDLHDIADGHDLPTDVQRNIPLEFHVYEDKGVTSAKQGFSRNKKEKYILEARHIDRWLHVLYSYLEENFAEDEVIVSLFSDHGQGYLVDNDRHFLSEERSNVAFMFRGGSAEGKGRTDEILSASDYSCMLRKLAGMDVDDKVKTDGRLPQILGGNEKREWALTESIHPKDFYQAAIFAEHETFFFINKSPVEDDGRFRLAEMEYWLEDTDKNRIENDGLCEKYLEIIRKHIAPVLIYE